jgi:hypothetical protein
METDTLHIEQGACCIAIHGFSPDNIICWLNLLLSVTPEQTIPPTDVTADKRPLGCL